MSRPDRDISKLKPDFLNKVNLFMKEVEPMGVFITEAYRTKKRQAELLKKGLSKVLVSNHQLGMAIDIAFKDDTRTLKIERELYPTDQKRWREVADIGKKYEIDWGYDLWAASGFVDKPHFQDTGRPILKTKDIQDTEKILAQRMKKAWQELTEANATKKYLAKLKGVPYVSYYITE